MPRKTEPPLPAGFSAWFASMRPRPDAAENRGGPARMQRAGRRFNEAAARCRGKQRRARKRVQTVLDALQ